MLRRAILQDLDGVLRIENRCFGAERFSRRQLRYLLAKAHGETWLDEHEGAIRGYVMLLFSASTSPGRIYSLAVDPDFQRQGVAARLVEQAEGCAQARGCGSLRLEIRVDNQPSLGLFRRMGYREVARLPGYYPNGVDGLRFEKPLQVESLSTAARARSFEQAVTIPAA